MKKEETKWIKPQRLLSLNNAKFIKVNDKIYTPQEFRTAFYKNAWQWNKYFWELFDANKILITL